MVVCANYVAPEVNNNSGTEINWGMFNYPAVEGGADPSNAYAGANSLAITKYSENAQAAFDFLMFLTSGEFDQKMADTADQIPADPSNTPRYHERYRRSSGCYQSSPVLELSLIHI